METENRLNSEEIRRRDLVFRGRHLPYNRSLVSRAQELRKNPTPSEKKLWEGFLKRYTYKFLRQRPIDHYIVDFYCSPLNCVIEIDGEQHCTEEGKTYAEERDTILRSYGLTVIRFSNNEVMNDFDSVCRKIRSMS